MILIAPAIRRYRLTILGIILLLTLGVMTYLIIPRQEDPLINAPGAGVIVSYPGSGPRDIEQYITKPLEEKLNEIEDLETLTTTSSQGVAIIWLQFDPDSDIDQNIQTLREKVREAEKDLPEESLEPEILKFKTETVSLIINLSGPFNDHELFTYANLIKRDLEEIPGIMSMEIQGDRKREVRVDVDQDRLSMYNISLNDVVGMIKAENLSLPGGHMEIGKKRYLLRTDEQYENRSEIGDTIIGAYNGRPIFLRDVTEIRDDYKPAEYIIRYNGRKSVNILITDKPRANLKSVSEEIRDHLEGMKKRLPAELAITPFADQAESVSGRLSDFQNNLLMGAGLVILVTMLMMNIRMAFVVAFLIPLSISFAIIMLYQFGHTLNQITLASMVIVLGMLVDSGIVVVENIQRHIGLDKDRMSAALDGSGEVLGAITSSTLTTVLAFTPLLFMSGETGQFIRGIPLTVIFALTGSLLVAIFVSPLLSYAFLSSKNHEEAKDKLIIRVYLAILGWTLRNKFITLLVALIAFASALWFIPRLGLQFFPKAEKDIFVIEVSLPQGTRIESSLEMSKRIEKILMSKDYIRDVMSHVGQTGPRIYYNINFYESKNPAHVQFFVTINNHRKENSTETIIKKLRPELNRIAGARIELLELEQGPPVGAPVAIKIKGDDLETLKSLALQYRTILETIPGTVDVRDNASDSIPQIRVTVDSNKARLLGITNASIAQAIRTAIYGTTAGTISMGDEEVDIRVSLGDKAKEDLSTFDHTYLSSMTGAKIPFKQVAQISMQPDIGSIERDNLTRTVTVRSDVQEVLPQTVVDTLIKKTASLILPAGYLVEYGGETEERTESFISLGWAMIAAVMLVYIVLVAQFNSFKQPLIIAFSIPFGLVGAVLGLWITGYPFGFMAFLGVVSLTGIVVNDAIVLIDFINAFRKEERDVIKAVIEAGRVRFRPVILTSVSTIGGLLPLSIRGGSLWGPMGNVIIFGLALATVLTLIIVPVIYVVLERSR